MDFGIFYATLLFSASSTRKRSQFGKLQFFVGVSSPHSARNCGPRACAKNLKERRRTSYLTKTSLDRGLERWHPRSGDLAERLSQFYLGVQRKKNLLLSLLVVGVGLLDYLCRSHIVKLDSIHTRVEFYNRRGHVKSSIHTPTSISGRGKGYSVYCTSFYTCCTW